MATDELWRWSAVDLAAAIATKKISSHEATQSAVARMRAKNPAINAVTVDLGDDALRIADDADAAVKSGATLGALHGVPVTVKQNVDFKGQANVNGVPAYANLIAPDDSPVVSNLRKAGAVECRLMNQAKATGLGVGGGGVAVCGRQQLGRLAGHRAEQVVQSVRDAGSQLAKLDETGIIVGLDGVIGMSIGRSVASGMGAASTVRVADDGSVISGSGRGAPFWVLAHGGAASSRRCRDGW